MTDPIAEAQREAAALRARLAELEGRMAGPPLTIERLRTMTTKEVMALNPKEVDRVITGGTRHATGPLTEAELADLSKVDYRRVAPNLAQAEEHLAAQHRDRTARQARDAETAALLHQLDAAGTPDARYRAALIRQDQKETAR